MSGFVVRILHDGSSEWLDADGVARAGWPMPGRGDRVVVLVPGEDVLLLDVARGAGNERQLSMALPFLVEEQLVGPVERQHVAWAHGSDAARVCVAVVARERMDAWLAQLQAAGLEPEVLLPEPLALPWHPERPTLLVDGGRCVLRTAETQGQAGSFDEIAAVLACAGPATPVDAWLVGDAQPALPMHARHPLAHALHGYPAQAAAPALNLLQGEYAPRGRSDGLRRNWRWAAMLAGLGVALFVLHALVDRQKLAGLVAAQQAGMEQLYRRAAPSATVVSDPARRLRSALAARGLARGDGAVDLLSQLAPAIAADTQLSLDSVDYREQRLELAVQADDVAGIDALRQRLARAGLRVEIMGTTPGTHGVQGRLRIGAAP
jgi:general secretion pathway protein L